LAHFLQNLMGEVVKKKPRGQVQEPLLLLSADTTQAEQVLAEEQFWHPGEQGTQAPLRS
jgi:hypothetical protein